MANILIPENENERQAVEFVKKPDVRPELIQQELITRRMQSTHAAVVSVIKKVVLPDEFVDLLAEFAPRLAKYKANYDRWPNDLKAKLSWNEIVSRLIANDALLLSRAEKINGVMFGVDKNGKVVFASGQKEPEAPFGMNYAQSRDAVMFEIDEQTGKKIPTGYELFEFEREDRSLMEQLEEFTGHPIVASEDGKEYRSIWLESGENRTWVYYAYFDPDGLKVSYAYVNDCKAEYKDPSRGVRRLLRV